MSETMKTRVLLYKAKWGDKSIIDNLISIRTWSKYSHVEIWTEDKGGMFSEFSERWVPAVDVEGNIDTTGQNQQQEIREFFLGTCWTSTMRGEDNGTVKRSASEVLKHPERWDYIELDVEYYHQMMLYMENQVESNKGYSKWDLLKFLSPWHFDDKDRNICSEFCNNALFFGLILKKFGIVSPGKLYKMLMKLGYKVQSLK